MICNLLSLQFIIHYTQVTSRNEVYRHAKSKDSHFAVIQPVWCKGNVVLVEGGGDEPLNFDLEYKGVIIRGGADEETTSFLPPP